jgi:hypothetical protein
MSAPRSRRRSASASRRKWDVYRSIPAEVLDPDIELELERTADPDVDVMAFARATVGV